MKNNNNKTKLFISERDMQIFYALTRYHLTGQMIFDLSITFKQPFTSAANARARLNQLYQAGFLKRDERLMKGRGNNQYYYFMTKKSASLIPELEGIGKKNVIFYPRSFARQAHSFLVSEVMVKLEIDRYLMRDFCKLVGFIRENYFALKGAENHSIRPDGTIFLNINGQNYLLFLEADRSTEPIASSMPNTKTFQRKIQSIRSLRKTFGKMRLFTRTLRASRGIGC